MEKLKISFTQFKIRMREYIPNAQNNNKSRVDSKEVKLFYYKIRIWWYLFKDLYAMRVGFQI